MLDFDAVIYLGTRYGEKLPKALLRDVNSGKRPVLWLNQNVYQLAPAAQFRRTFGWVWKEFDTPGTVQVNYKGTTLRPADSGVGLTTFASLDRERVKILATATTEVGTRLPWAVRSKHLTYIGTLPVGTTRTRESSLALADLLHDLKPSRSRSDLDRRRALVRIEDIGPMSNPQDLRETAQALKSRGIPYSIAVYPVYVGPITNGSQQVTRLADRPDVVRAITEMLDGGATLVLHGYTHQFENLKNPRSGESGTDYEFFRAHLDEEGTVVYDGPVPGDSQQWAEQRLDKALADLKGLGLPRPNIFNVPHYAASPADYRAIKDKFAARYDRGQYFDPSWDGSSPASPYMTEQSAPYLIRDRYGSLVVPENLGYISDPAATTEAPNTKADVLKGARAMLSVRDSVASFFYHPFLGTAALSEILDEMQRMGYTFVSPCEL